MIELINLSKWYSLRQGKHIVLDNINLRVEPGEKVGVLGRNGEGKSTLIRILSGADRPNTGQIRREMKLSWPLAFSGGFQGSLTGLDNLKFICRVYGVDFQDKIDQVQAFAELGKFLYEPTKTYSQGMRARLAFAISLIVDFDCFLIDEVTAVGDASFRSKCDYELFERRRDRAFIFVSHDVEKITKYCERAFVINGGKLWDFPDINDAIQFYKDSIPGIKV